MVKVQSAPFIIKITKHHVQSHHDNRSGSHEISMVMTTGVSQASVFATDDKGKTVRAERMSCSVGWDSYSLYFETTNIRVRFNYRNYCSVHLCA